MFEKILKGNRQLFPFFVILAKKVYFMDISHIFKRQKDSLTHEDKKLQTLLNLFGSLLHIKKSQQFRRKNFSSFIKYLAVGVMSAFVGLGFFVSSSFLFMTILCPPILFFTEIIMDLIKDYREKKQTHILIDNFLNSLKTKEDVFSLLYSFQKDIHSYGAREEYNLYAEQLITNVKQILQLHLEHDEVSKIYELCYNTANLFENFYQKAHAIIKKEDFNTSFEAFVTTQEKNVAQKEQEVLEQFQINKEKELVKYL